MTKKEIKSKSRFRKEQTKKKVEADKLEIKCKHITIFMDKEGFTIGNRKTNKGKNASWKWTTSSQNGMMMLRLVAFLTEGSIPKDHFAYQTLKAAL